jgi:glutathionylspermidine synthase
VKFPWLVGKKLRPEDWHTVRSRLMFECCKWDIQSEDHCVVADFPLALRQVAWEEVAAHAEALSHELLVAEQELLQRPDLQAVLGLPRSICKLMRDCAHGEITPGKARVMRFDFHFTREGWRISEVNADVPGGFIESSGFTQLMAEFDSSYRPTPDIASLYCEAILGAVKTGDVIALVHATAHSDDRQVMQYLAQVFHRMGLRAIPISPGHLWWESGIARIDSSFARKSADFLVRFFPAEWLPGLPAGAWEPWFCGGRTAMSNPGCAILIQSKRFPLTWDKLTTSLSSWRLLLPETRDPREVDTNSPEWVLKPVLGRVGEDIGMAGITEEQHYKKVIKDVRRWPGDWIAQRRFETIAVETPDGPRYPCLGIFTVDGRAAGAYGRISSTPLIDQAAQDIAVLLSEGH